MFCYITFCQDVSRKSDNYPEWKRKPIIANSNLLRDQIFFLQVMLAVRYISFWLIENDVFLKLLYFLIRALVYSIKLITKTLFKYSFQFYWFNRNKILKKTAFYCGLKICQISYPFRRWHSMLKCLGKRNCAFYFSYWW